MEEAHRAECIHGNVLQWPPQLNFSPWVNLTDQALSWSVYKYETVRHKPVRATQKSRRGPIIIENILEIKIL